MHISEICTNSSCEIARCNLRHPKVCKFFRDYKRCKFGEYCYFLHKEKDNFNKKVIDDLTNDLNERYDAIKIKIEAIDEQIAVMEAKEVETLTKLENIFQRKIDTFENSISILKKCLAEKDGYIVNLETRLNKLEEKVMENNEKCDEKVTKENRKISTEETFKCNVCVFVSTSEKGLKAHVKVMHTKSNFLKTCSLCDKTFKSYRKFRDHKFDHTAWDKKTNKYSCKECDFVGNNMFTHEVHMGKAHSQNFDCGLCDKEFDNLENLEIHLNTCEIYRCRHCINKEKTVSDIKKHTEEVHGGSTIIDHIKMSRENRDEVSETMYFDSQL